MNKPAIAALFASVIGRAVWDDYVLLNPAAYKAFEYGFAVGNQTGTEMCTAALRSVTVMQNATALENPYINQCHDANIKILMGVLMGTGGSALAGMLGVHFNIMQKNISPHFQHQWLAKALIAIFCLSAFCVSMAPLLLVDMIRADYSETGKYGGFYTGTIAAGCQPGNSSYYSQPSNTSSDISYESAVTTDVLSAVAIAYTVPLLQALWHCCSRATFNCANLWPKASSHKQLHIPDSDSLLAPLV
jgi:hypothetical protein